ncbi:MAG: UbiA family prenyltransferase [Planctomycetota bacterium]
MGTLRAYVELARLSNAPTCATNVLVGAAAAAAATGRTLDWTAAALTSIGVVLLYVAGMALNDLVDVDLDRRERPRRPLPSGRVSMSGARRFVAATLALGWGLLAVQGWGPLWFATVLVVAIVLYDLLHRAGAAAVILMGLCRGLVYPVAFTAALTADGGSPDWTVVAWPAAAMTAYIVALSVVARREMAPSPGRRLWPTLVLPLIVLAPAAVLRPTTWLGPAVVAAAVVAWLSFASARLLGEPPRVGAAVLGWLAGICLADALWLTLLDQPIAATAAGACFVLTVVAHRRIAGT